MIAGVVESVISSVAVISVPEIVVSVMEVVVVSWTEELGDFLVDSSRLWDSEVVGWIVVGEIL